MFCNECGRSVAEGSKFCLNCGSPLRVATQQTVQVAAPVQQPPPQAVQQAWSPPNEEKKKGGGFWSSGAGITLVVILGLALIAGVTFGIIFLVKGDSNNSVDAATVKVWDEYESIADNDSTNFATIKLDSASLTKAQEDLKKSQDKVTALEKTLKEIGGTTARRQGTKNTNTRDIKADQMAATLAAYNAYVTKMNELFKTLVGANLLDPNVVNTINGILADLQDLSAKVKTVSNDFLANNTKVVTGTFNPAILATPKTIATVVQNNVNASQAAEQQRLAAEKAAADQAAANAEAEAARREAERVAAEQATQQGPRCPNCGASDPSVWMEMRGSYYCYNCGYRQEK